MVMISPIQSIFRSAFQSVINSLPVGHGFSPLSLFAAGEKGAWYDPSDLSTLFQDAAGTTPVTAAGQPVGLMRDKSGRSNHASQVTAGSKPILRNSGALWYLEFDGVDDFLLVADNAGFRNSKLSLFVGVNPLVLGAREDWFACGNSSTFGTNNYVIGNSSTSIQLLPRTPAAVISLATISPITTLVAVITSDNTQSLVKSRINGVQKTDQTATFGTDNAAGLFIGKSFATGASAMYLYGLIVRGAMTDVAGITSTEKFMGGKSGVTL